ncbi:MAG: D-alanine--D-alanine ligase [Vampirovibrionales bacterium]|nr:D-alanine--D-alanine ligase [Vampirovibrionales bacterium]
MTAEITHDARIAVLCGGLSSERDVSLRSGQNCYDALLRLGYHRTVLIDVDRRIAERLLQEDAEIAFLALHGRYGEDGAIQGMLEILGIPYTGCGIAASALAMDKDLTKRLLMQAGLPVLPSLTVRLTAGAQAALKAVETRCPLPAMVKPINEGSSVGMSRIERIEDLGGALELAASKARVAMIEQYVEGRSMTIGVIDIEGAPTALPVLELRTPSGWYDYEAKYTEGKTEFILPAELPPEASERLQQAALAAHRALGCHGVSRTDVVVDDQLRFYLLEVNTIPGMTSLSDLPAQAHAMGIGYDALVEIILMTAQHPR